MYYGRDKIISIRVNSKLLEEVKTKIESKTTVYDSYGCRKIYTYHDSKRPYSYDKFTIADLLEEKLKEYLEGTEEPRGQK